MQKLSGNKKNIIYSNNMETNDNELARRLWSSITNSELENLVRMREDIRGPIPTPRRNVQQLMQANLIPPYRPIPAPRRKKQQLVAGPRTRISEKHKALNGFTKSYEIDLKSNIDALEQLQNTRLQAIGGLFGSVFESYEKF